MTTKIMNYESGCLIIARVLLIADMSYARGGKVMYINVELWCFRAYQMDNSRWW